MPPTRITGTQRDRRRPGGRGTAVLAALALTLTVFLLGIAVAASAAESEPEKAKPTGVPYVVDIRGVADDDLLALLKSVSQCELYKAEPPASVFLLKGRTDADLKAFKDVFNSRGYFQAAAEVAVNQEASPVAVVFQVDLGEPFVLSKVEFALPDGEQNRKVAFPAAESLGLTLNAPFSAKAVLTAQDELLRNLRENGRPFPKIDDRKITADFTSRGVAVLWKVDPGPDAAFGETVIEGLTSVDPVTVRRQIPWTEDRPYDARLVDDFRTRLTHLGLFSSIQAAPEQELDDKGRATVKVTLLERKHRTFKGGVDYKSDEGPGANLSWEHRNLFGQGEKLSLSAGASPIRQFGEATFENPAFLSPRQKLTIKAKYANEEMEAYVGWNATATANVRRDLTDYLSAAAGVGYRHSVVTQDKSRPWESAKEYHFVFVPLEMTYDSRDDLLDPTEGFLTSLALAPFVGVDGGANFLRPELNAAHYWQLTDGPTVIWANRLYLGADLGAQMEDLPSDLRFYAGGGGSIRGYPYQTVGPLRSKTPTGGRSVFTFSSELRLRFGQYFGLVPFLDGGSAFADALPPYNEPLRFGAGLGFRVYTPIGPIRLDVAAPLQRRPDIDDIGQFYISIGQAF